MPKANRDKEQIVSEDPWQPYLYRQNLKKNWAEGVRLPTEPDIARRSYARDAVHERDFPVEPGEFTDEGRADLRALLKKGRDERQLEAREFGWSDRD